MEGDYSMSVIFYRGYEDYSTSVISYGEWL